MEFLADIYNLLSDQLRKSSKSYNKSVILTFLKMQSASRYKSLKDASFDSTLVPPQILKSLLQKDLIQCIENVDKFAITAKGVWQIEQHFGIINEDRIISFIDDEYFQPRTKSGLDDEEKVILLTLISSRAFSISSAVDTKRPNSVLDQWRVVLEESYNLLNKMEILSKLKKEKFLKKRGNVHIVNYIFRHNNEMVEKTRGIYSYSGKQEYYLDLVKNSELSEEKLSFLFWAIFKGNLTSANIQDIIAFCNRVSSEKNIYLFDMATHLFSMPKYNSIIRNALIDSVRSKDKWEYVV